MKIALICLFALVACAAAIIGRSSWKKRRRRADPDSGKEETLLGVLADLLKVDGVTVGEPMDIMGFTGRERLRCIRAKELVFSVYSVRKGRRYGFIVHDEGEPPAKYESREYPKGSPQAHIIVSWLEWRLTSKEASEPVVEKVPATEAVSGTSATPPPDPFDGIPDDRQEATS